MIACARLVCVQQMNRAVEIVYHLLPYLKLVTNSAPENCKALKSFFACIQLKCYDAFSVSVSTIALTSVVTVVVFATTMAATLAVIRSRIGQSYSEICLVMQFI